MTMPGFTAEDSLSLASPHYGVAADWTDIGKVGQFIIPQATQCSPCYGFWRWRYRLCCSWSWWPPRWRGCRIQRCG